MERRRILGSEKQVNAFEPFYSDFPEISSENDGVYQLTHKLMTQHLAMRMLKLAKKKLHTMVEKIKTFL